MLLLRKISSFKATCFFVGSMDILLAGSMFANGVIKRMAEFKIPEPILSSPHYSDAMHWVFLHMLMIGILIILIGLHTENSFKRLWTARILVLMHCVYAFLDFRTSDSAIGNGLYQGSGSIIPALIDVIYILLFLRFSIKETSN